MDPERVGGATTEDSTQLLQEEPSWTTVEKELAGNV